MLKAVLLDFDGTLVNKDILDVVCGIVGKEQESEQLNQDFHSGKLPGLTALITRINFLKGVTLTQISNKLDENAYLMPGAHELFSYFKQHSIISIIHSGNLIPILEYYKTLLNADYIVGTHPKMNGDFILGISEEDFPGKDFKVKGVINILEELSINGKEAFAIGDSPADKAIFELAEKSIAIDPKGDIDKYADYVIKGSLQYAIPVIDEFLHEAH
jgi:HAD superfamily phosphoserine phosphatase-like hydrolase